MHIPFRLILFSFIIWTNATCLVGARAEITEKAYSATTTHSYEEVSSQVLVADTSGAKSEVAASSQDALVKNSTISDKNKEHGQEASSTHTAQDGNKNNLWRYLGLARYSKSKKFIEAYSKHPVYTEEEVVSFENLALNLEYIVTVEGAKDADELQKNIVVYLSTLPEIKRANFETKRDDITKKIEQAVEVFGYYHSKIYYCFNSASKPELEIKVIAGKPLWIRNVSISVLGEGMTDPRYMRLFRKPKLQPYTTFRHSDYESLKADMMSKALSYGYFDAKFVTSRVIANVPENFATIIIAIDTGRSYRIGAIHYDGDTQYEQLVKPLIKVEEGTNFNLNRFSRTSQELYTTGYFRTAEIVPELDERDEGSVPVKITLKRKSFNLMETGLGYATDEGIRGRLGWSMPLLNETGHSLTMQTKLSAIKQEFLVRYKIPRKNPNLDYYYLQAQQSFDDLNDTEDRITSFQAHYVANVTGAWKRDYWGNVQYEDFEQGQETGNGKVVGVGFMISRLESRPRSDPREGNRLSLSFFSTARQVGSDYTFSQLYGVAKQIFAPTENSRLMFRAEQGVNFGHDVEQIPPSFRFFTGGDTTVRGFGYKKISDKDDEGYLVGGRYLSVGSVELQVPIVSFARLALFTDAGTATNDYNQAHINVGSGLGGRFITPIGLVRLDFALGVSEVHPAFHLHFGIGPDL